MTLGLAFKPMEISNGKFMSSNVLIEHSRKLKYREVKLIGSTLHDAWLLLEFDPSVIAFCERPPLDIDVSVPTGRKRALDFWIEKRDGSRNGLIVFGSTRKDAGVTPEELSRSVALSRTPCEIWCENDLLRQDIYLRNLKQINPYLIFAGAYSQAAVEAVDKVIRRASRDGVSLSEIFHLYPQVHRTHLATAVFTKFHDGSLTADLKSVPLSTHTKWQGQ